MSGEQKKPVYKKWWFWLGAVIAIGIIAGVSGRGKKESQASSAPGSTERPVEAEKPKETPALAVTAIALYEAYDANEVSADAKYKGKKLAVTGEVKDVEKTFGNVYVNLTGNEFLGQVTCKLESEADAAKLTKGQTVTLVGTGDGKTGFPRVVDCVLASK